MGAYSRVENFVFIVIIRERRLARLRRHRDNIGNSHVLIIVSVSSCGNSAFYSHRKAHSKLGVGCPSYNSDFSLRVRLVAGPTPVANIWKERFHSPFD